MSGTAGSARTSGCDACPANHANRLLRFGVSMDEWDYVVALTGNPNTGKSTVFNALTGLRQHTGNWPGKTVTRAEGGFEYAGKRFKLVDLPGTYSLLSASPDEEIARNFMLFGHPDVIIVVVDATRLERNLNLVLQVLEITSQAVICLNLMDEAGRHGLVVDERRLSRDLGVPVVPMAARYRRGLSELLTVVNDVAIGRTVSTPHRIGGISSEVDKAVSEVARQLEAAFPGLTNTRWVAMRLLDGDTRIIEAVRHGTLGEQTHSARLLLDATAGRPK